MVLRAAWGRFRDRLSGFLAVPEIEQDMRLRMLLAALNFLFHVTFGDMFDVPAFSTAGTRIFNFVPLPVFENMRGLVFLNQFWTNNYLCLLSGLGILGFFLALAKRCFWSGVILAFLFPNAVYYYLQEFRWVLPYHYVQMFLTFMFLISKSKLFFFRLALLCCYFDAACAKMTPSWLLGEAFNSVPDKLPLLPKSEYLVLFAGWGLITLELFGPLLWFSRRKALRMLSVSLFIAFHLYSCTVVGWVYPSLLLITLIPAFLDFSHPIHWGYRFVRTHLPSWIFFGLLILGGIWPLLIPGPILVTREGRFLRLSMFEANREATVRAEIWKGAKHMILEVERPPRTTGVEDPKGWRLSQGIVRGELYERGLRVRDFDPTRILWEEGTAIWNPQLFTAGESVLFGDPYIAYFYGKEVCRRYKPDRLDLRLWTRLNRRGPVYRVLDIEDFCGLNPTYNPFWRNDWILFEEIS